MKRYIITYRQSFVGTMALGDPETIITEGENIKEVLGSICGTILYIYSEDLKQDEKKENEPYLAKTNDGPQWVEFDENGTRIYSEYTHQDGKFAHMCKSNYCRCSN